MHIVYFRRGNSANRANPMYKPLKHFCVKLDLNQLINEPTRITPSSQTTIDLVLVSDKTKISKSGVIDYGLSDHLSLL